MPERKAVPLTVNTIERAREVLERLTAAGVKATVRVDPCAQEDLGRLGEAAAAAAGSSVRPIGGKEPCPCGSGQRYKRCCKPQAEAAARPQTKLSTALLELARPVLAEIDYEDPGQYRAALSFAVLAWNLTIHPELREGLPERLAQEGHSKEDILAIEEDLALLIPRMRRLFPDERRFIVGFDVRKEGTGYWLQVYAAAEDER